MKYLLTIFLLLSFLLEQIHGQELNYVDLTKAAGLTNPEVVIFAMAYDSTYVVLDAHNKMHNFDGYVLTPIPYNGAEIGRFLAHFDDHSVYCDWDKLYLYQDGMFSAVDLPIEAGVTGQVWHYEGYEKTITINLSDGSVLEYDTSSRSIKHIGQINVPQAEWIKTNAASGISVGSISLNEFFIYDSQLDTVVYTSEQAINMQGDYIYATIDGHTHLWTGTAFGKSSTTIYEPITASIGYRSGRTDAPYVYRKDSQSVWQKLGKASKMALSDMHGGINNTLLAGSHAGLGLYYPHILYYEGGKDGVPEAIHTIVDWKDGHKVVGSYTQGLHVFDGATFAKIPTSKVERQQTLPGGFNYKDDNLLFFDGRLGLLEVSDRDGVLTASVRAGAQAIGYMIDTLRDGRLAYGLYKQGLGIEHPMGSVTIKEVGKEQGLLLDNVLCFAQDDRDRIWCGRSSKGIAVCDKDGNSCHTWLRDTEDPSTYGAMSMLADTSGALWLGTNAGLYHLAQPHTVEAHDDLSAAMQHIPLPDGSAIRINAMAIVDSFLVFGGDASVNFLNLNAYYRDSELPPVYQYRFGTELQGNGVEQNTIHFDSDRKLWIGCQSGILVIDWDHMWFDHTTNEVVIRSVECNGAPLPIDADKIALPTDRRSLNVRFGVDKNVSMMRNIYFDYSLIEDSGDTLVYDYGVVDGVIEVAYVPPGNYRLNITAKKHGKVIDKLSKNVEVPLTLSENPWFWTMLMLGWTAALVGFVVYRQGQRRLQYNAQLQLSTLENEKTNLLVQSIVSSFNPHFINNSLHWIQSRYSKDEKLLTVVDKLSKNLRAILTKTQAGKAYHTVEEELIFVNNYVDIQKVRFPRIEFDIQAQLSEELLNCPILIMQLQIHVENAVEHGINNREEAKKVKLTIEHADQYMHIRIEDDGVGRKAAKAMQSHGTQRGTKMLSSLHTIFNKINELPITQQYDDNIYTAADGTRYGTRVSILIPIEYSYEAVTSEN